MGIRDGKCDPKVTFGCKIDRCWLAIVNTDCHCQLERIYTYLGNKSLGMSLRNFLDCIYWSETIHTKQRRHHSIGWNYRMNTTGKGREVLPFICLHLSLLPDCGHHVTGCLTLLSPCLPNRDGQYPQTVTRNKPFLPSKLPLVRYLVTATRKVTNIDGKDCRSVKGGGKRRLLTA